MHTLCFSGGSGGWGSSIILNIGFSTTTVVGALNFYWAYICDIVVLIPIHWIEMIELHKR